MYLLSFKKKGFTLIELLVVIAIIGLMASIILVALSSARNKAKDGRAISEMAQIRPSAELYYTSTGNNSYSGLACTITTPNVKALCDDINTQTGTAVTLVVKSDNRAYCAYAKLLSTHYWCVDSAGNSLDVGTTAPTTTCVASAAATCK